jgi:hypothetical protein
MKCIICKMEIRGYPNNAFPIAKGCCCDECNKLVIAERLKRLGIHKEQY